MAQVIAIALDDGRIVYAEADAREGVRGQAGLRGSPGTAIDFRSALDNLQAAAGMVLDTMRSLPQRPKSCEVTFGIKLSAEAGAIFAKAGGEANFTVTLTWEADEGTASP